MSALDFYVIAVAFAAPLFVLPLAAIIGGGSRLVEVLIVSLAPAAIVTAGSIFTALAVDLNAARPNMPAILAYSVGAVLSIGLIYTRNARLASQAISSPFEQIAKLFGQFAMLLVFLMAFIQFTVVILRYVFGVNFIFMQESVTYLHGFVFLLAAGYALLTNDHVRVDIFYSQMSARKKAVVDLFGAYLFLTPFCLITLWMAAPYVANSWAVLEGSTEQSGIQGIFILKTLIPIFATLLLMAGFVTATRAATTLRGEA
jgi:TRAP-type mannitol/chloroaromatic compound transport system permease small subunit